MPFTFAHPAAAVPLHRSLGRFGVLSALVIGSTTPDAIYFLPLGPSADLTHGLPGLLSFCLPLGLVLYLIFHAMLKAPCLDLLSAWARTRLAPFADGWGWPAPGTSPWGVPVSIVLGAVTHIVWDSFTHADAPGVRALPVLSAWLFESHGYRVHVFKLLQHLSSVVGLALLAWWGWRWLRSAPESAKSGDGLLPPGGRALLWIALTTLPFMAALWGTLTTFDDLRSTRPEVLLIHFVVLDIKVLGGMLLLYSMVWRAALAWRGRAAFS